MNNNIKYGLQPYYSIELKNINNLLYIEVKQKNELYELSLTLDELQILHKYFTYFTTIDEIKNNLLSLIHNRKINFQSVYEGTLTLKFNIDNETIISFILPLKDKNPLKTIKHLGFLINRMEQNIPTRLNQNSISNVIVTQEIRKEQNLNILTEEDKLILSEWINPYQECIYNLIYKATINGDNALNFHNYCDTYTPTLILILTSLNEKFGGITYQKWNIKSMKEDNKPKGDNKAFLFSLTKKVKKLIKNPSCAIIPKKNNGPCFGIGDIYFGSKLLNQHDSFSKIFTYQDLKNKTPLISEEYFIAKDVEVYHLKFKEII